MMLSVSVALLLAGFGSVTKPAVATVAVLTNDPVALTASAVCAVKVATPLTASVTVPVRVLPLPPNVQLEPAEATQVQLFTVKDSGKVSVTGAVLTAPGPLLPTTMV
jgi:hypothetical protein